MPELLIASRELDAFRCKAKKALVVDNAHMDIQYGQYFVLIDKEVPAQSLVVEAVYIDLKGQMGGHAVISVNVLPEDESAAVLASRSTNRRNSRTSIKPLTFGEYPNKESADQGKIRLKQIEVHKKEKQTQKVLQKIAVLEGEIQALKDGVDL